MKNKGVFITIVLILVFGCGITFYIHDFVTADRAYVIVTAQRASSSDLEFMREEAAGSGQKSLEEEAGSQVQDMKRGASAETMVLELAEDAAVVEEAAEDGAASGSEPKAAVLEGPSVFTADSTGDAGYYPAEETETYEDFQKKLEETDKIMEEMRQTGALANTTDALKMTAEYEYRLWDTELNRIYQAVIEQMTETQAEGLRTEERQWIRERDQTARQAADKFAGGTMESLEYTASLASSTRERAYGILEQYGDLLPQK